ncbi:MAG: DMT family transporter [Ectothiorhodospiraceae bacterium]|nr:DMT family transporter [Ectothiorhodospiraceae bacterium]
MASSLTRHRQGVLLAALGTLVLSFDALLVRLAAASAWDVIFWRGLLMALSLTLALRVLRGRWSWEALRDGRWPAWAAGAGFALTLMLFVLAVLNTRVANVVVIIASAPFFAALLSGVFLREWVPLRTWLAMTVCLVGILVVFAGSVGLGGWLGDLFALLAALTLGANLTLLRRHHGVDRLAVVAAGGIIACIVALLPASPGGVGGVSLFWLAVMGLLQMPLALALMAEATRYLPSAEVSLFLLVETVLGTWWVWMVLGEEPPPATLLGGGLILFTLLLHAWLGLRRAAVPAVGNSPR